MENKFEIIKAEGADFETIQSLAYQIWPTYYSSIISMDQIEYMLRLLYSQEALLQQAKNGQKFFLAKENENIVGFMGLSLYPNNQLKIDKLYLSEECRGKGFGVKMIDFAEVEGQKAMANCLFLNVNRFNESFGFYKKRGFSVVKNIDIPFGPFWLNDFILEKKIGI